MEARCRFVGGLAPGAEVPGTEEFGEFDEKLRHAETPEGAADLMG